MKCHLLFNPVVVQFHSQKLTGNHDNNNQWGTYYHSKMKGNYLPNSGAHFDWKKFREDVSVRQVVVRQNQPSQCEMLLWLVWCSVLEENNGSIKCSTTADPQSHIYPIEKILLWKVAAEVSLLVQMYGIDLDLRGRESKYFLSNLARADKDNSMGRSSGADSFTWRSQRGSINLGLRNSRFESMLGSV